MTPNQVTNAYRAVLRLSDAVFPYATARNIARLKKRLEEEVNVISDEEKKIVERNGGEVRKDGTIIIEDPEQAGKCTEELNDFRQQEDDIKVPSVDLSKYVDMIRISPADIDALEGLVIFGEEENG